MLSEVRREIDEGDEGAIDEGGEEKVEVLMAEGPALEGEKPWYDWLQPVVGGEVGLSLASRLDPDLLDLLARADSSPPGLPGLLLLGLIVLVGSSSGELPLWPRERCLWWLARLDFGVIGLMAGSRPSALGEGWGSGLMVGDSSRSSAEASGEWRARVGAGEWRVAWDGQPICQPDRSNAQSVGVNLPPNRT